MIQLLKNRNVIMTLGLVVGLLWEDGARWTKDLTLPVLAIIMTLSTMSVTGEAFRSMRAIIVPGLMGILMNFILHGSVLLGLNYLFIQDDLLRTGFIILAAVPPAVAVIPFALFLKGNQNYALFGTIGGYIGALVITPLIVLAFLGSGFINPLRVLVILLELIIAPLIMSRILLRTGASRWIEPVRGTIINWGFFLVIYIMVGLNREIFLHKPYALMPVIIIGFLSTFVLGWCIEKTGRVFHVDHKTLTSIVLLGTYKNYGLAGGLALVFFNPETAVPATVMSIIGILYIIWLEFRNKRKVLRSAEGIAQHKDAGGQP